MEWMRKSKGLETISYIYSDYEIKPNRSVISKNHKIIGWFLCKNGKIIGHGTLEEMKKLAERQ